MSLVGGQIDDFVVASFPAPPVTSATAATTASRTTATYVNYTNNAKIDHRVAIASPRVGLAVYDLDDQTPLASISVGPSFAPCTAPASRSTPLTQTASESTRVKSLRKTWIGVRSTQQQAEAAATDVDASARAGEIWCFHEDENKDGSTGSADAPKAVWPISEPLASIVAPRTLPEHIVFLAETGTLALAPQDDLTKLSSLAAPPLPADATALSSQTLRVVPLASTISSDFLPSSLVAALPPSPAQPHLAFIVRTYSAASTAVSSSAEASLTGAGKKKHKKQARPSAAAVIDAAEFAASSSASGVAAPKICQVELVLLDAAISVPDEFEPRQGMLRLGRVELPGASDVVVSDEGFVTALDASGTLSSYRLGFTESLALDSYHALFFPTASTDAEDTAAILPLALNFVKSTPLSATAVSPARSALLALHSSFVALASPRPRSATSDSTSQGPSVSVTYWDTRFGSVIASTELAVPSAVAANVDELAVSLSRVGRRTAIVVIEPAATSVGNVDKSIAKRTVLFGLPLNGLPSASVLAAVVGKHTLTAKFVAASSAVATGSSDATASTSTSASSSGAAILEQARRAEPMRSELLRTGNEKKAALLEQSRVAREQLLESLAGSLEPLWTGASVKEQDKAIRSAESSWDAYIDAERNRLWEYNKDKVRLAMEKEKERRVAAIAGLGSAGEEGGAEPEEGEASRYKVAKRRIERAIAAAGAPVRPGTEASAEGGKSWKDVTAARIKGVNDKYRYRYHLERNKKEAEMGQTVKEFDWEEAVNKVERFEPSLPSSFVTALLRLSFPVPLADASSSLEIAAPAVSAPRSKATSYRHPTKIVGYLLGRELVGENQVEGGVTRFLARAGDWPNILQALRTVPDIPESTLVSLLVAVVRESSDASEDAEMDVDDGSASLPARVPRLSTFLAAFLQSPYTGADLRSALQKQLSPSDAVPVLQQCDDWLQRWLNEAEPVRAKDEDEKRKRKGKGHQTVAVDVFKVAVPDADVPALDQIVTFVQAVLDAHFVTLLLQRQSHRLLRRLSQHVARHNEMTTDLSSLLGALSIYSSKKEEQRRATAVANAAAALAAETKTGGGALATAGVKEFGATMEKRIAAQEKHAEVGQYQVEEFYL